MYFCIMLNIIPLNVILLNTTMPKSLQWQRPPPALTLFHFWLQRIFWQESKADADPNGEADADEVASNVDPQKNNSFEAFEKFDTFHFEGNEPWRGQIKKNFGSETFVLLAFALITSVLIILVLMPLAQTHLYNNIYSGHIGIWSNEITKWH